MLDLRLLLLCLFVVPWANGLDVTFTSQSVYINSIESGHSAQFSPAEVNTNATTFTFAHWNTATGDVYIKTNTGLFALMLNEQLSIEKIVPVCICTAYAINVIRSGKGSSVYNLRY